MARIKKLTALLAIAFAWAHKMGEWRSEIKPIKIKKHGRLEVSIFRLGLDYISAAVVNALSKLEPIKNCLKLIEIHSKTEALGATI